MRLLDLFDRHVRLNLAGYVMDLAESDPEEEDEQRQADPDRPTGQLLPAPPPAPVPALDGRERAHGV